MKKLTSIAVAIVLLFSTSAFSMDDSAVSAKIKTVFEQDFASASNVKWTQKDDYYVASFKINENEIAAAYNGDGELLMVSRYINLSNVPLKVSMALEEKFAGYAIDEKVIELAKEQTSYLINVENAKRKMQIEVDTSGVFSVKSKTKKH